MASVPENLKYSKTHEWLLIDDDIATVGITDHAQEALGEIVYLDLGESGRTLNLEEKFGEVESVKAVSELYAPVSGEVVAVNTEIGDDTGIVNRDPFGEGWLIKIKISNSTELANLLNAVDYETFAENEAH